MKPIFITEEEKERLVKEFADSLKLGMYNGAYTFSKSFVYTEKDHPKATLVYTADAFAKTISILNAFDSEVAWHAFVRRSTSPEIFIVDDIVVYPQEVTGSTVNTDDAGYADFLIQLSKQLPEEKMNAMHGQCHSHVNMGTSPSSVDKTHQEKVLQCMNGKGFYVFQIWNKKLETTNFIYDFDNNIMYESKDIDLEIVDQDGYCISDMIADAKRIVKTRSLCVSSKPAYPSSYTSNYSQGWYGGGYDRGYASGAAEKKEETESTKEKVTSDKKKYKKEKVDKNKRLYIDDDLYWDDETGMYVNSMGYMY